MTEKCCATSQRWEAEKTGRKKKKDPDGNGGGSKGWSLRGKQTKH
jgi:hypothetical protein